MYKMTTKSGEEILVASFDGGGCFVGSYDYDVAYMVADGGRLRNFKNGDRLYIQSKQGGN